MKTHGAYVSTMIYNLGLFALIGFSVWQLKSPIPLLGLIMIKSIKQVREEQQD
ncbi:hypothetical protein JCM15765_03700 [Paradesulfitobacterium aromaticivorans]